MIEKLPAFGAGLGAMGGLIASRYAALALWAFFQVGQVGHSWTADPANRAPLLLADGAIALAGGCLGAWIGHELGTQLEKSHPSGLALFFICALGLAFFAGGLFLLVAAFSRSILAR